MTQRKTVQEQALHHRQEAQNDLVLSFMALRRAVGLLGFFLPLALLGWSLFHRQPILPTISDYYYSPAGVIFTGTLCAIAVFLWSYQGFRRLRDEFFSDLVVARAASLGALGTAVFPTVPKFAAPVCDIAARPANCNFIQQVLPLDLTGVLHLVFAALFFGALAVFCLVQFTRGSSDTAEKRAAKLIYRVCGALILLSMGVIAAVFLRGEATGVLVFWAETLACFAFATGWAVKGDGMGWLVRWVAGAA